MRLIVVLGHSQCGAVKAAIKHIDANDVLPGSISGLVDLIKPAVAAVKGKHGNVLDNAIEANVEQGVERLKRLEPILADSVKKGALKVVGAVYDLRSGKVTAFGDGLFGVGSLRKSCDHRNRGFCAMGYGATAWQSPSARLKVVRTPKWSEAGYPSSLVSVPNSSCLTQYSGKNDSIHR